MLGLYLRISDPRKQTIEQQLEPLENWAKRQFQPYEIFSDKDSGENPERKGFLKLKEKCQAGIIKHIGVWKIDRLGRRAGELLVFLRWFIEEKGGKVTDISTNIDTSTPFGRMAVAQLASFAEFENELKRERMAISFAKTRKENDGVLPWTQHRKPRKLTQDVVDQIIDNHRLGLSKARIARRSGICIKSVYRVLHREDLLQHFTPRNPWGKKGKPKSSEGKPDINVVRADV